MISYISMHTIYNKNNIKRNNLEGILLTVINFVKLYIKEINNCYCFGKEGDSPDKVLFSFSVMCKYIYHEFCWRDIEVHNCICMVLNIKFVQSCFAVLKRIIKVIV